MPKNLPLTLGPRNMSTLKEAARSKAAKAAAETRRRLASAKQLFLEQRTPSPRCFDDEPSFADAVLDYVKLMAARNVKLVHFHQGSSVHNLSFEMDATAAHGNMVTKNDYSSMEKWMKQQEGGRGFLDRYDNYTKYDHDQRAKAFALWLVGMCCLKKDLVHPLLSRFGCSGDCKLMDARRIPYKAMEAVEAHNILKSCNLRLSMMLMVQGAEYEWYSSRAYAKIVHASPVCTFLKIMHLTEERRMFFRDLDLHGTRSMSQHQENMVAFAAGARGILSDDVIRMIGGYWQEYRKFEELLL